MAVEQRNNRCPTTYATIYPVTYANTYAMWLSSRGTIDVLLLPMLLPILLPMLCGCRGGTDGRGTIDVYASTDATTYQTIDTYASTYPSTQQYPCWCLL